MDSRDRRKLKKKTVRNLFIDKFSETKRNLNLSLPFKLRTALLNMMDFPSDTKDDLLPPASLRRIIGQEDTFTNLDRLSSLKTYCGLKPTDSILDVGCGCGGIAYSLIKKYNFKGKYEGFDIIKDFTDWLSENITPRYPNFRFVHANVYSRSYNSTAKTKASKYKFPYPNNSFDIVVLSSVFTHMLPDDVENYLSEIARVLKPNGKAQISYFLLSPHRPKEIRDNEFRSKFVDSGRGYSTTNLQFPEDATAYQEESILSLYNKVGLVLAHPIIYGALQDLIISKKI